MRTKKEIEKEMRELEREIFRHDMKEPWDELDKQTGAEMEKKLRELEEEHDAATE